MKETRSTCAYCGTGCGVVISTSGGRIVGVRGDERHPSSLGRLCSKGSTLHLTATPTGRLLQPQMRTDRSSDFAATSWDTAFERITSKLAGIINEHGPQAVGFYISGQLLTEDYYCFNKVMKGLIGTNNIDSNSRLCVSSAGTGYKLAFGVDAPPTCYEDIFAAKTLFVAGANPAFGHPIVFRKIEQSRAENPQQRLIVVDPRVSDTAAEADLHLQIKPGTDVALFNSMLCVLLESGTVDRNFIEQHTEGFEKLESIAREYTPERAAAICGVPAEHIVQAAQWFGDGPTLSLYCVGLNQSIHGTSKNTSLINLHLATANVGKPGAGPFGLTGQPNAMGGREVGGMATLLSGHRDLGNEQHRAEVARFWGVNSVPAQPGKTAGEMIEALASGEMKAIWIVCTNPAHSMPDQELTHAALQRAELVVVQEAYSTTETGKFAHFLLPARSWGEKEGTVTNSERRITRVIPAVAAPGETRSDWSIAAELGRRLAPLIGKPERAAMFDLNTPEQVWNEHRALTRGRDLDITGLSYALLEERGPQFWPFPAGAKAGEPRLYTDHRFQTASGRAKFNASHYLPTAEVCDDAYPLSLTTGRLRDHWHSMSRSGQVARLFNHVETPLLSMHPADMEQRALPAGAIVRVASRRGSMLIEVQPGDEVQAGTVFIPMNWGAATMKGFGSNILTLANRDAVSKQPEIKHAAVQVIEEHLPFTLLGLCSIDAVNLMRSMHAWVQRFEYGTLVLYGHETPVAVFRAFARAPFDTADIRELEQVLGITNPLDCVRYEDAASQTYKVIQIAGGEPVSAIFVGDVGSMRWVRELLASPDVLKNLEPWMLAAPWSKPPGGATQGRIVCACCNVSSTQIETAISAGASLEDLKATLKCGTKCGSCVPEIKRMIASNEATV